MKLHWLLPGTAAATVLMVASPTLAATLESWRFDANQNRLFINTSDGVQPKAQLIFGPTRLVIDLPGTRFGRSQLTQPVGGAIRAVRVGQFDEQTARIVVELAPGYTLDPKQVQFQATVANRWAVQLPKPEAEQVANSPLNIYSVVTTPNKQDDNKVTVVNTTSATQIESLQTTGDGFFVRTSGENPRIQVNRSNDKSTINFDISGATLSPRLTQRDVLVNRFGVSRISLSEVQSTPPAVRMTLQVNKNSPDWRASSSTLGGLVLLPNYGSGVVRLPGNTTPTGTISQTPTPTTASTSLATINSVELTTSGTQLVIKGDRNLSATGGWDRTSGLFRIVIPNARLAQPVKGPAFGANSPVLRVRLQQQDQNTVAIFVQPTPGVQIGQLNQIGDKFVTLQLQRSLTVKPPVTVPVPVRPNPQPSPGPIVTNPQPNPQPTPRPPVPNGRVVIVVDPGHGGKDSGAPGIGGLLEKDVILPISKRIAAVLQQNGIQAVLTRDADYFVELQGRVDIADRKNADLFVSIHANSVDNRPDVNGLETYYYDSGYRLAQVVHSSILQNIPTIKDRGVRKARFYVLRKSSMPSILVETGYMTGRQDNPRLGSTDYQNRMADAIARGILLYLKQR